VTGGTSTSDVVLYQRCQDRPITYDVRVSPDTTYWRLEIQVADPKGHTSEGRILTSDSSPTHGTVVYTFCGSESPGTYAVRAAGFYRTLPLQQVSFTLPETSFEVRPMATRTTLAKKRLDRGGYRLTTSVKQQGEHGYDRANGIPVRLERRSPSGWHRVRGLTLTTVHGRAVATVARPGAYRAVVTAHGNHGASTSQVVTLSR
jgi:hypothetical protein